MAKKSEISIKDQNIRKVSGAIITCYTALHYLQETKHLKVFRHTAAINLTRTLADLIEIERNWFDEAEKIDTNETSAKMVSNQMQYTDAHLDFDFLDFTKLQEISVAFTLDRERIVAVSDSILLEHNDKKK
tara:strand:- start:886 stop:1278 length:393 start_codon:yes stop_codon:yes gene_type:complete